MLSELENATVDFPIRQIHGRIHDPRHCGWGQLVAFVCLCFFRGRSGTQQCQKGITTSVIISTLQPTSLSISPDNTRLTAAAEEYGERNPALWGGANEIEQ